MSNELDNQAPPLIPDPPSLKTPWRERRWTGLEIQEALSIAKDRVRLRVIHRLDMLPEHPNPSPARTPEQIVRQHRREIELSPGVGVDAQTYGLAVCDDILNDLARLASAPAHKEREQELQQVVDTVYEMLQMTPDQIARHLGESRVKDDSGRVNYALELLAGVVSITGRRDEMATGTEATPTSDAVVVPRPAPAPQPETALDLDGKRP